MTEEQKRKQWFVVQVLSGQENKVNDNLVKRIKTEEMGDLHLRGVRSHRARLRDQAWARRPKRPANSCPATSS